MQIRTNICSSAIVIGRLSVVFVNCQQWVQMLSHCFRGKFQFQSFLSHSATMRCTSVELFVYAGSIFMMLSFTHKEASKVH